MNRVANRVKFSDTFLSDLLGFAPREWRRCDWLQEAPHGLSSTDQCLVADMVAQPVELAHCCMHPHSRSSPGVVYICTCTPHLVSTELSSQLCPSSYEVLLCDWGHCACPPHPCCSHSPTLMHQWSYQHPWPVASAASHFHPLRSWLQTASEMACSWKPFLHWIIFEYQMLILLFLLVYEHCNFNDNLHCGPHC